MASDTLRAERLELAAVNASSTVTVTFAGHVVASSRVTGVEPFADWQARDALGLRANGSHPLGVAGRCARLLAEAGVDAGPIVAAVDAARRQLDDAGRPSWTGSGAMVEARARASLLAVRAAAALVATGGGRSVTTGEHGQRLMREAMFLLVFGQTPAIKAAQMAELLGT